jgi:hypothetical protein
VCRYSTGTSGDWLLEVRASSPGPLEGTEWRAVTVSGRDYDAGAWRDVFRATVTHYADRIEATWTLHKRDNTGSSTCTAVWMGTRMQLRPARYWFSRNGSDGNTARVRSDWERTSGGCDSGALVDGGSFWNGDIDAVRAEWSGSEEGTEAYAAVVLHTVTSHGNAALIADVVAYDGTGAAAYHDFGGADGLDGWTASGTGTVPAFYPSAGAFEPSALIPRAALAGADYDGLAGLPQVAGVPAPRVLLGRLPAGLTGIGTEGDGAFEFRVRMRADAHYLVDAGGSYAAFTLHGAAHP